MNRWPVLILTIIVVAAIVFGIVYLTSQSDDAEALMDEKEFLIRDAFPGLRQGNGWFIVRSYEIKDGRYHYEFIWHQQVSGRNYKIYYDQPVDLTKETVTLVKHVEVTERHF